MTKEDIKMAAESFWKFVEKHRQARLDREEKQKQARLEYENRQKKTPQDIP